MTDRPQFSYANSGVPYLSLSGEGGPCPDREALLKAASDLVPRLRERCAEVQQLRGLPEATIADLKATGLLNMTRPRWAGGHEADVQTLSDVVAELARGCPSTAWVTAILNAGSFIGGACLPAEGSKELFDSGEPTCAVANFRKGGTLRRTEGGYTIEATEWPWASGSQLAGWALLRAVLVDDDDQPVDSVFFLIPMSELTVIDDWHTTAMRGTASNTVRAEAGTFIPEHRVGGVMRVLAGDHLADVPSFTRMPFMANIYFGLGPVAIGIARWALEEFIARVDGKPMAFTTHANRGDLGRTHFRVGEARELIDAADLLSHRAAATLQAWADSGTQATVADRVRIRADLGMICRLCTEAVNSLYEEVGASAIMERDTLSMLGRDIRALSMHGANNPQTNLELWGQVLLGQPPAVPTFGPVAMT